MSVIVSVKDKDRFVLGCDIRMSGGGTYNDSYYDRPKLIKLDNNVVVGAVGNTGLVDIFANELKKLSKNSSLSREYLLFKVVMPINEKYKNSAYFMNDNSLDGDVIIAKDDKCYIVFGNLVIDEVNSWRAIGCGERVAVGSLITSYGSNLTPQERIANAIYATGSVDYHVSKQSCIIDTKNLHFEEYNN